MRHFPAEEEMVEMEEEEKWESIPLVAVEMDLQLTLSSGQAFRWIKIEKEEEKEEEEEEGEEEEEEGGGIWGGVIEDRLFILRHRGDELQYRVAPPTTSDPEKDRGILRDYFRLDHTLSSLYTQWAEDENFNKKVSWCQGVRLLRQPPLETLLTFICSSNNNIVRISLMVTRLSEKYGQLIGSYGGNDFYSFPTLESLVGVVSEADLRTMGFGYRARYVKESVEEVGRRGGEAWLMSLRQQPYEEAKAILQQLPGVGSKVADCVCLMGLDHLTAVPVDVHVWRLAQRDYGVGGASSSSSSLTSSAYCQVGDKFREVFGETAGWAQAVLFTAELRRQKETREGRGGGGRGRKGGGGGGRRTGGEGGGEGGGLGEGGGGGRRKQKRKKPSSTTEVQFTTNGRKRAKRTL